MSYHILHQFDEQLLADIVRGESEHENGAAHHTLLDQQRDSVSELLFWRRSVWFIVAASLVMAAFALSLALDARHRADDLQQRLEQVKR